MVVVLYYCGTYNNYYVINPQEAKLLIAQAYRQTEKLLLDNRDKLTLVRIHSRC